MRKLLIRSGSSFRIIIAISATSLLMMFAAFIFLRVSLLQTVLFLVFQALCVALPGVALIKLFRIKLSPLENAAACYGMGLLYTILIYFMLSPFGLGRFIPYVIYGLAPLFAAGLYFLRGQKMSSNDDRGELKIGLTFSVALVLLTTLLLSAANLTPDVAGARGYYHDLTNAVALIASAHKGFPLEFLQLSHTPHFYHPFFYAYCAVVKFGTGISAFDVGVKYSLVTIAPLFALSFAAVAKQIFFKARNIAISCAAVMLFFFPMVYYLTIDLLGFSLGLAFSCLCLLFFIKAEEVEGHAFNRLHLISMLFLLGCLGAKGANGVTALFALCFVLLFSLIRKRRWLRVIGTGLLYAVPFFIVYFLLYQKGPESMMFRGDPLNERMDYFLLMPDVWPEWLRVFLSNVMFTVNFNRTLCLCLLLIIIYAAAQRKKPNILVDYSLGGLICGLVLSNLFMQDGGSEVYFLYAVIPMAVTAGVYCAIRLLLLLKGRAKILISGFCILFFLPVLTADAVENISRVCIYAGDAINYSPLRDDLALRETEAASTAPSYRAMILTPKEYEGLVWLRDNAGPDAVVADGRYLFNEKCFLGTAFSEQRYWLEGWRYAIMSKGGKPEKERRDAVLSLFYGAEEESFVPLLRSHGISHVVIYEHQNPGWRFANEFGSVTVFDNGQIAIYDIRSDPE